jgi:hypothetical protein
MRVNDTTISTPPAPLDYGPDGWDPESFVALHLYMIRFGEGESRAVEKRIILDKVKEFAAANNMIPWPTRRNNQRAFGSASSTGFFQTHWPGGLASNGKELVVRFASITERDRCMWFLRSRGHDVAWLDPRLHRKAVSEAEERLRLCLARPRSPHCRIPGHRGHEQGGALGHAFPCGTCDLRRAHAHDRRDLITRASVSMKLEMARKEGKEFPKGNPPAFAGRSTTYTHDECRRMQGGNASSRTTSLGERTRTTSSEHGRPAGRERRPPGSGSTDRERTPRGPLHAPPSPASALAAQLRGTELEATPRPSRSPEAVRPKELHGSDPLRREPLLQPRPDGRNTLPAEGRAGHLNGPRSGESPEHQVGEGLRDDDSLPNKGPVALPPAGKSKRQKEQGKPAGSAAPPDVRKTKKPRGPTPPVDDSGNQDPLAEGHIAWGKVTTDWFPKEGGAPVELGSTPSRVSLALAAPSEQKNILGDHLLPHVLKVNRGLAPQVIGRLLTLDNPTLLNALDDPSIMGALIAKALAADSLVDLDPSSEDECEAAGSEPHDGVGRWSDENSNDSGSKAAQGTADGNSQEQPPDDPGDGTFNGESAETLWGGAVSAIIRSTSAGGRKARQNSWAGSSKSQVSQTSSALRSP